MTTKEARDYTVYTLSEQMELREAKSIAKILFEDLFKDHLTDLTGSFPEELKEQLELYISRLIEREPIQYITGKANFYGYDFKVNNHVLIPRPETEELVHWILQDYEKDFRQQEILDIGTGSGCIAITLKLKKPSFRVFGIEYDLDAYNVSRINARQKSAAVQLMRLDIFDESLWRALGFFDVVVSNPPYVPESERHLIDKTVVDYEPAQALFVEDADPLIYYKTIAVFCKSHLKEGGSLYLEINEFHASEVWSLLEQNGFQSIEVRKDMQGKERMVKASVH